MANIQHVGYTTASCRLNISLVVYRTVPMVNVSYYKLFVGWKVHTDINHKHYLENNLLCIANNVPNPIRRDHPWTRFVGLVDLQLVSLGCNVIMSSRKCVTIKEAID